MIIMEGDDNDHRNNREDVGVSWERVNEKRVPVSN